MTQRSGRKCTPPGKNEQTDTNVPTSRSGVLSHEGWLQTWHQETRRTGTEQGRRRLYTRAGGTGEDSQGGVDICSGGKYTKLSDLKQEGEATTK